MTSISSSAMIRRIPGLLATEVDGETVLMHVDRGHYYGLARTAKAIWDALERPASFDALCSLLATRYEAPRDVIEADVRSFLEQMRDEGLVELL